MSYCLRSGYKMDEEKETNQSDTEVIEIDIQYKSHEVVKVLDHIDREWRFEE